MLLTIKKLRFKALKIFPVAIVSFLYLSFNSSAFALEETPILYPVSVSNCANIPTGCTNIIGAPDSQFVTSANNPFMVVDFNPSIATGASIVKFEVTTYGDTTGNNGSGFVNVSTTPGTHLCDAGGDGNYTGWHNNTYVYTINNDATDCGPYLFTEWAGGVIKIRINKNTGFGNNFSYDSVGVKVFYEVAKPSISVNNFIASSSGILFTITGDTTYTSSSSYCRVSLFQQDADSGELLSGEFARIILDAQNPRIDTLKNGNEYLGYGYTPSVSTWTADGISGEFISNRNVNIASRVTCYDPYPDIVEDNQGLSAGLAITYTTTLISTPTELQNGGTAPIDPCPEGLLHDACNTLVNLFIPDFNQSGIQDKLDATQLVVNNKAPFAYINELLDIDLSPPTASQAGFILPIHSGFVDIDIPFVPTGGVLTFFQSVRFLTTMVFWAGFIAYLFFLMRRVLA